MTNDDTSVSPSFEAALEAAYPALQRILTRQFHDPQLAEEIATNCLVLAWKRWQADPCYFDNRSLLDWLTRLAVWRTKDVFRKQKKWTSLVETGDDETPAGVPVPSVDARAERDRLERMLLVWDCIGLLSPEEQRVVVGYDLGEETEQQIGDALFADVCTRAARGLRVHRLRPRVYAHLRELLVAHGFDGQAL